MIRKLCGRGALTGLAAMTMWAAGVSPVFPETALATTLKQGGTTVTISPPQVSLTCPATQKVDILIGDVEQLFGVDLKVSFDPNVVEVVDADVNAPGVTVQPGNLPDVSGGQGLVQENTVDVATGTINYAAIRLAPAQPQDGSGIIASVTFKAIGSGTTVIKLAAVALADATALPISATLTDGEIDVTCDGEPVATRTPTATATRPSGGPTATATRPSGGKVTPLPPGKGGYPTGGQPGKGGGCTHVIKPGETLYSIARLYGTTASAIASANGILYLDYIYAGQSLVIPGCTGPGSGGVPPWTPGGCLDYVVKPGDTLYSIALAYGDTVAGLQYRNGIVNPNLVWAGQTITVCGAGGGTPGSGGIPSGKCRYTHVVKPGETLYGISLMYGSTVYLVSAANGLANPNLIYAGQVLCIP